MKSLHSSLLYLIFSSLHTFYIHRSASRFTYRILTILPTLQFAILTVFAIPTLLRKARLRWMEWRIAVIVGALIALMRHAELLTGVEEVEIGLIVAVRVILFPPMFQFINGTITNIMNLRLQSLISLLFSVTALCLNSSACSLAGFSRWVIFGTLSEFTIIILESNWIRKGKEDQESGSWWELLAKAAPVALVISSIFTYPYITRKSPTDPDYRFLIKGGAFMSNYWWCANAIAYGVTASLDSLAFFYLISTISHSDDGTFGFLTFGSLLRMVVQLGLDEAIVGKLALMGGGRVIGRGRGHSEVWCIMVTVAVFLKWTTSKGWIWRNEEMNSIYCPEEGKELIPLQTHSKTVSIDSQRRDSSLSEQAQLSSQATRYLYLSLIPFGLFIIILLRTVPPNPSPRTLDIVMSYFDESIHLPITTVQTLYSSRAIADRSPRFIMYVKNEELANDAERLKKLKEDTAADYVITGLENMGRESGTYLRHILINYDTTREEIEAKPDRLTDTVLACPLGLATHTHFIQAHLSWEMLAVTKMELLEDHTGFLTGTVWLSSDCGKDGRGNGEFPRMAQIYEMFKGETCPPTMQLATYSGQFFVSRKRILENEYGAYKALDDLLEAPLGSAIYEEGWDDMGPSNPFLGHAVERSWPTIFDCMDTSIAERCYDSEWVARRKDCQCYD